MDARNGDPEAQGLPVGHPPIRFGRIGVLLLNLGTPDGTGYGPMRRYLKEFLSDPRVIELPRWKWWPILNLIILTVRPGRKGRDYAKIWNTRARRGAAQDHHARAGGEAQVRAGRCAHRRPTGPCATPTRARPAGSRSSRGRVATAC